MIAAVALALRSTQYGLMVSAGDITQLLAVSALAGAIGAVLGAGLGAVIRNVGGAVTTAVLVLFVIPPLAVQLVNDAGSWIPTTLFAVISGVSTEVSRRDARRVIGRPSSGHLDLLLEKRRVARRWVQHFPRLAGYRLLTLS